MSKPTGRGRYQSGGVASVTSSTIFRGYDVREIDGKHVVSKDGAVLCSMDTEQEAFAWINHRADEAVRKRKQAAR